MPGFALRYPAETFELGKDSRMTQTPIALTRARCCSPLIPAGAGADRQRADGTCSSIDSPRPGLATSTGWPNAADSRPHVYNKTLYFVDHGTPRGTAYDQGKLLEEAVNRNGDGHAEDQHAVRAVVARRTDPGAARGRGDIIMADLTVTPERASVVDFAEPWIAASTRSS
jgi:hypothetical protein